MNCRLMAGCLFFNGLHEGDTDSLKEVYCKGDPTHCARRQVAMAVGREPIPLDLAPNHTHRVQAIINDILSRR